MLLFRKFDVLYNWEKLVQYEAFVALEKYGSFVSANKKLTFWRCEPTICLKIMDSLLGRIFA